MKLRVVLLLLASGSVARAQQQVQDSFPHARHAKMFPTCEACHAGIATGNTATGYPAPSLCANCHDGRVSRVVKWNGPAPHPTNLAFSHQQHAQAEARAGSAIIQCTSCHARPDSARIWMAVRRAPPAACLTCHAHAASGHLADDNVCSTCHVPLTRASALTTATIAAFPRPPSHDQPGFLSEHAPRTAADEARCATCHTRESCERCHVNADKLATIIELGSDARVAHVVAGRPGVYPVPTDHQTSQWATDHADAARRSIASCANCHAQSSCAACHIGRGATAVVAALPVAVPGKAQGVVVRHTPTGAPPIPTPGINPAPPQASRIPDSGSARAVLRTPGGSAPLAARDSGGLYLVQVHWPGFLTLHAPIAATGQLACASCHTQRFCTDCHAGEQRRNFHPANFIARHANESYNRQIDCTNCHNPEAFCRTCHFNVGVGTRNPRNAAFHTGQPLWLLQHGQAARQSLESCTTCHQQQDCMRCHSTLGWGVNPHGPGFDPRRMAARNLQVCLECHLTNPLTGPGQ